MPTPFSFQRYQLQNQQGEQLLELDFNQPAQVPQSLLQQVLADLRSFAGHFMPGHVSELTLKHDDTDFSIKKLHDNQQLTSDTSAKLAELEQHLQQSALIFLPQDINAQHLVDYLQRVQEPGTGTDSESKNLQTLREEFAQLSGEIGQKLLEAEEKLVAAERELSQQRKADDAQLTIGQLEGQIKDVEQKLVTVDKLIAKQGELSKQLAQIESSNGKFTEEDVAAWREQIKQIREAQIAALASNNLQPGKQSSEDGEVRSQQYELTRPAVFWGMVLILLIGGGVSYLFNRNPLPPLVAAIGSVIILMIYHSANRIPRELNIDVVKQKAAGDNLQAARDGKATTVPESQLNDLEQKFLHKAWIEVYQQEIENVKQVVNEKLDGEDHSQLTNLIGDLKTEIADMQKLVAEQKERELTPDKYLAKRREVDMLKVEKARLETDMRGLENFNQINEVRSQLELLVANYVEQQELTEVLQQISGYQEIQLRDNQMQFRRQDGDWTTVELTKEQLQQLAAVYLTEYWLGGEVRAPLILVDWDKSLPRMVRSKISDRMNKRKSDIAQVIFLNTI